MKTRQMLVPLATLLVMASLATAAEPAAGDALLQQELKQQQLQRSTQRLSEQLGGIVAEFERNGLAGEDLRTLKSIQVVLGRLGEKDMRRVIALLQQARTSADATASRQDMTGAYSGQKTILTLLRQLLLEFERQQALYELSIRFREMAARQSQNMRAGVAVVRNAERKPFTEEQKLSLQVQQLDQAHIKDETLLLVAKLDKLAADSQDNAAAERPKAAAKQAREGGLRPALESAVEQLKPPYKLSNATSNEKRARDEMREIARLLLLSKEPAETLRAAIRETEAAIVLQKQVMAETAKMEKREDAAPTAEHQLEVVDNADSIRRDVSEAAPAAVSHLRTAIDRMQEAYGQLRSGESAEKKRHDTPPKQSEAVTSLEHARRAMQEQLAKVEEEAAKPENALAQTKELQQQVQELAKQEEKLKEETAQARKKPEDLRAKAPEQAGLKNQTQDAEQKAADTSPAAAQALQEAADQMEKARELLARGKNAPTTQQNAIDSLKRAEAELGKEVARLEEKQKQLAGLEQLSDKVGDLIKQQQQVNADTAKEAAQPNSSRQSAKDLANKEASVAKDTAAAQKQAEESAPAAAPHLAEAKAQMNTAKDQLGKPDAKSAQAPEKNAMSELSAAKQQVDRKAADLKQELGMNTEPQPKSLAEAAAAIEKAQSEVNQAMAQMQNAPPGLMDSLAKQQQQIADALKDNAKSNPAPKTDQAQKAATKAAEQLNQGDLQQAVSAMQQAQDAMAEAQASAQSPEKGQKAEQGQQSQQNAQKAQQGQQPSQSGQKEQTGQQPAQNGEPGQQSKSQNQAGQNASAEPSADQAPPSLPQLAQQQSNLKKQAQAMLASQQATPAQAMQSAAKELSQAAKDVTPVASGEMGQMPAAAEASLQAALDALNNSAAQAAAQKQAPAQAQAAKAAQALAQAQAALELAQAGLNSEMAQNPDDAQAQGQQPGQGKKPGQPNGKQPAPGKNPGQQAKQQPQPGQKPGQQPNGNPPPKQGNGEAPNPSGTANSDGPRRTVAGPGQFTGLPQRDRAALQQSQGEKYPQEYGPMVEQYLRNLSDQSGAK